MHTLPMYGFNLAEYIDVGMRLLLRVVPVCIRGSRGTRRGRKGTAGVLLGSDGRWRGLLLVFDSIHSGAKRGSVGLAQDTPPPPGVPALGKHPTAEGALGLFLRRLIGGPSIHRLSGNGTLGHQLGSSWQVRTQNFDRNCIFCVV